MRGLTETFLNDLKSKNGALREILDFVQVDDTLALEIRNDNNTCYINIYYRGSSLYKISAKSSGYSFKTDKKYFKEHDGRKDWIIEKAEALYNEKKYLYAIPYIKAAIDRNIRLSKRQGEKEVQQLTVYENNRSPIANSSHYYIADFEYQNTDNGSRFDLVAIKWPNKRNMEAHLCVIEVKFGYKSVGNSNSTSSSEIKEADITKHLDDVISFFSDVEKVNNLKAEALRIFNQKQELKLIEPIGKRNSGVKYLEKLEGQPEFMLWLVDYPPTSTALDTALNNNKEKILDIEGFDFVIASSSYAGYALFSENVISVKEHMGW